MAKSFILTDDCHVSQVTFGNQINWIMKKGEKFIYGFIKQANNSFTLFQNGLNLYVFESRCIPPEQEHLEQP